MHKPAPFYRSFEKAEEDAISRFIPQKVSVSGAFPTKTKVDGREQADGSSSFSTRGNSTAKLWNASTESGCSSFGQRKLVGGGKKDSVWKEGFSLLPSSKSVPQIIMDPLAVLRQCIRYFACHPEVYGTNLRCVLDREIMHVMRLQASESSITLQQPVLSSDDVFTAVEFMQNRLLPATDTSTEGHCTTSTSSMLPPLHLTPSKGSGVPTLSEARTGALLSNSKNASSAFSVSSPPQAGVPKGSHEKEKGRENHPLLGYGSLLFMPIRYDFEALTQNVSPRGGLTNSGGGGGERMPSTSVVSAVAPPVQESILSPHRPESTFFTPHPPAGVQMEGSTANRTPKANGRTTLVDSPNHPFPLWGSAHTPQRSTIQDTKGLSPGSNAEGAFKEDECKRDGHSHTVTVSDAPLMIQQDREGEGNEDPDSTDPMRRREYSVSPSLLPCSPSSAGATTSCFVPNTRASSMSPVENGFIESLKQVMEQQFQNPRDPLDYLPTLSSASSASSASPTNAVGSPPTSMVLVDANGYEVSYIRRQLQQMEAAYNAKCIRLHELVEENAALSTQLKSSEEKGEQWLSQFRESNQQVEGLKRELEGWREKAEGRNSFDEEAIVRRGRKGVPRSLASSASPSGTGAKSSLAHSRRDGRESELERISKLWRETEKSLQETRRGLENTEKEANSTHDHLTDAFHYIERLERRVARRNQFIFTASRRQRSLEEKYEKLMWCFREQSSLIGAHSFADHAMADDPYWSLFTFYHLHQHFGDTYPMEETLLLGSSSVHPPPTSSGKAARGAVAGQGNEKGSIAVSSAHPAPVSVPNLQFGRCDGGGRLMDEKFSTTIIYSLMADEATGLTERRGRLKRLRTNLVGAVGCKVLRWENMFVIDYLGGEESRPNATALSRVRLPLLTLASLTQPLRDANGVRLDVISVPPPSTTKSDDEAGRRNGKQRSVSEAPTYAIPDDVETPNTLLYDQSTVRLLLRNFWRERVEQFSTTYYSRVQERKQKATRLSEGEGGGQTSWAEGMKHPMEPHPEDEEVASNDTIDAETYPNTFLAGLMVYVFRLCGAKRSAVEEQEESGNAVKQKGSVPTGKETAEAMRTASTTKEDNAASMKKSVTSARGTTSVTSVGGVANEGGQGPLPSLFLSVSGVVSKDPGLWDDGCLFFACVANAKIRTSLQAKEASVPPHLPEFSAAMREMLCAMYYYTMEYKDIDPDFRLFYLVSHQFIPEMVGINFYCGIEAIQLDCEALLKENVNPNADGKVLEKIKKDAFPHTVAGGDGNFLLLGGSEFLISAPSRIGESHEGSTHKNLLINKLEATLDASGGSGMPTPSIRSTLGSIHRNGSVGGSMMIPTASPPSAKGGQHVSSHPAFPYALFSPVEAIAKAAELIDHTPIIAETACLEEDSEDDGYGSVLPGVVSPPSSPTLQDPSTRNNSTCLLVASQGPMRVATPKDATAAFVHAEKRTSKEGKEPVVSESGLSSAAMPVVGKGEGSPKDVFHSPRVRGGNEGPNVVVFTTDPEGEMLEDGGGPHDVEGDEGRGSSVASVTGGNPLLNDSLKSKKGRNVFSSGFKPMHMPGDGEMSKLRHDLLDYLETLQYRRSSFQKEEYEKRKERIEVEQRRRLGQRDDPRETWQQLDGEIRRIFGTSSELLKDFTSLEVSDGVGGPTMGGFGGPAVVQGTARGSSKPGSAKGPTPSTNDERPPSSFPVASNRRANPSLFLSNRRQRIAFDSRIRKSLAATRGLIPQEDFLLLFHKHFFATYAITACGAPRFPISCSPMEASNAEGKKDFYAAYDRIGFIPPLPIHLQRLRMALSLDQPTALINYRQLFSTDVCTFSPTHFYAEFLTLTLDVFLQQQNFLMHTVLSSCSARHSRYFEVGAEECDGWVPISSLKSGFTQSLAMIDATASQAAALVEHLQEYADFLRFDEIIRVEQFTDLPILFTQNLPFGEGYEDMYSSVDMADGGTTEAQQRGGEEYTSSMMQLGGSGTELWHFEDEAATCSLLHLSLAIRMLYPIWGTGCLKQAKRLSERLQSWTPVTKVDPSASVVPPILQVNVPCTPFETEVQRRYLISAHHLAQGDSGFYNPLRVTAKWILEEARVKAYLSGKDGAVASKDAPTKKSGFSGHHKSGFSPGSERSVDIGEELVHYDFEVPPEKQLEGGGMIPNWRFLRQAFGPSRNAFPNAAAKEASKSMPGKGERRRRKSTDGRRRRSSTGSRSSSRRRRRSTSQESTKKKTSTKTTEKGTNGKDVQPSTKTGTAVGVSENAPFTFTSTEKRSDGVPSAPPPTRDFGLYMLSRAMGMSRSYAIQGPPSKKKKKGAAGKKGSSNLPFGVELQLRLQQLHSENTRDMFGVSQSLLYELLAPLQEGSIGIVHDVPSAVSSLVPRPPQPTASFPLPVRKSSAEGVESDSENVAGNNNSVSRISAKESSVWGSTEKAGRRGGRKSPGNSDSYGNVLVCPPWAPGFRNVPLKRRRSTATMLGSLPTEAKALPSGGAAGHGSPQDSESKVILYVEDLRSAMAAMSLIS